MDQHPSEEAQVNINMTNLAKVIVTNKAYIAGDNPFAEAHHHL